MAALDLPGFVPFQLDRYSVLRPLGQGGMAEVFLAEVPGAQGFNKLYCIKRIKVAQASRDKLTRMLAEEAHLTNAVTHPNVVQVFELQEEDGQLFLVLEYVDGGDLFHLLQSLRKARLQLPVAVACHIICCVLRGLHHAHKATDKEGRVLGLVHRDVTPSNVLLSRQGGVKLADFGVALARAQLETVEQDAVMGKPSYMSPEAVQKGIQDVAGDVWGAGVVLWETLTARRLFVGVDVNEQVRAVVHGPIPPPSVLREDISPELDAVVALALQRNPAERFPDARTFEMALYSLIRDQHPDELAEQLSQVVDGHGRVLSTREVAMLPRPRRSPTGSQVAVVPRAVTIPGVPLPPPTQSGPIFPSPRSEDTLDSPPSLDGPIPSRARMPAVRGPARDGAAGGPVAGGGDDFFAPLATAPVPGPNAPGAPALGAPRQVTMDWPPPGREPGSDPGLTPQDFLHAYDVPAPFTVEHPTGTSASLQASELYDQLRAGILPANATLVVDHVHRAPAGPVGHQLLFPALWQAPAPMAVPTAQGFFPQEAPAFGSWASTHAVHGLLILEQLADNHVLHVVLRNGRVDLVMDARAHNHPLDAMRDDALDANGVLETVLRETIMKGRTLCDGVLGLGLCSRPRLRQLLDQVNLERLSQFVAQGPCRFAFHFGLAPPLDTPPPTLTLELALQPPVEKGDRGFDSF